MRVELRDYQQLAFDKAREAIRDGAKRVLIVAPTGGGKTVLASALMAMTQAKGNRASFVVDRLSLIQQTSDTFDRYQIDHGVIQGGHERWAPHHPIQLCSVQTLGRRGWPETSVDVFDECFPGNTIVHTADGEKRIDSIQVGELVLNAAGAGLVRSVFSKSAKQLLKVRLSNGTVIRCTPDHPIFTDAGWTNAERLAIGSRLYRKEDVCGLWEAAPAEILSEQSDYDMEGGIRKGIQQSHLLQSILREEIEEPNVFGVLCPEDGANPEKYRTCTESKGGEWNAFASDSANGDACSGQRLGVGVRGENQTQSSGRIPTLLQDRRCESDIDDCAGAGRFFALCEITQIARREEGRTAAFVRVESVEVEEHQRGITVYNLRVGGHPSYFADGILVHNCHVLHTTHKKRLMERSTIVVGLTATPFTKGLGKWFDVVINVTTTRALIEQGWLSPYRIFSCAEPDMSGVAVKSTGEWDDKQASGKALEVVGDVVAEYLKHGEGRKFICSGVDTAHVEELQRQFLAAGINAATYTYKDLEEDRAETTNEFRRADSSIRGLITVTAASRGFDVPDVSCVIMARPLRKSLAEHIQLFGRGLRISPETEKKDCIVLDHSGNCARFFDDCESFFDLGANGLDNGDKKDKKKPEKKVVEPIKCPSCRALHKPMPSCPCCGHEYPRRPTVEHVAGTLKELIAGGYRKQLTAAIWPQVCAYVRERREGEAARKQALAIYKEMTGNWPLADFDSTKPVPISPEVRSRIKAQQIRYAHRRAA